MPLGKWSSNYHPSGTLVSLGVAIRWWHNDILNRCLGCTWWPWKWRSLADYWLKMTSIAYSWWILLQNGSGKTSPREPRCSKWLHRRRLEFWSPANGTTDTSIKTGVFRAKKLGNTRSKSRSRKIMFLCCAVLTGSGWICRWSMTKQRPAIHYHPCLNSSFIFLILSKSNKNPPGLVRGYNFPGLCGPADFGGSVKEDPGSSVSHHRRHRRHGWRPRRPWGGSVSWRLSHAATLQGPTKGRGRGGTSSGSHGCCWVEQFQKKQLHGQWSSSSIPSDPFQIHFRSISLRAIFPGTNRGAFHRSSRILRFHPPAAIGNLLVALLGARLPLCGHWSLLGEGAKGDSHGGQTLGGICWDCKPTCN